MGVDENLNGNCGETASPSVVVQNNGYDPITSLSIEYSINNGSAQTHNWSGSLGSLESTSIELPSINYSPSDTNSVNISVSDDDNNENNSDVFYFDQSSSYDTSIITLNLVTDNYGSETTWQLTDSSGYVVAQDGPFSNNNTYSIEIEIPSSEECYTFTINDSYGDGICCAYGTGSYSISDDSSNVIVSGGEFSSVDSTTFRVGESLGLNSFMDEDLKIFPNPSNGVFTIKTTLNNSTYKVHNLIGQTIKSGFINSGVNSIDIRNSIDGVYFITIESKSGEKIGYKLIKN
jgi:lysyl endopeptidase